jgi:nitrogen regulatory protein PII
MYFGGGGPLMDFYFDSVTESVKFLISILYTENKKIVWKSVMIYRHTGKIRTGIIYVYTVEPLITETAGEFKFCPL